MDGPDRPLCEVLGIVRDPAHATTNVALGRGFARDRMPALETSLTMGSARSREVTGRGGDPANSPVAPGGLRPLKK